MMITFYKYIIKNGIKLYVYLFVLYSDEIVIDVETGIVTK
jgi:hypothetical protein